MEPPRETRFFTTILYKQGDQSLHSTRSAKPPKRKRTGDLNQVDFSGPEESEAENLTTNPAHDSATVKLHPAYRDPFYYPFDTREHDGPTIDINDPQQSRTAGLDPSDPIPAPPFPHNYGPRGSETQIHLPTRSHIISALASMKPPLYIPGDEKRAGTVGSVGGRMEHKGRNHHANVLTTLMLRCVQEGDWERAGRAWGMLIRTAQGRPVDVRTNGMWGLGAEILLQRSKELVYPPSMKTKLKTRRRESSVGTESEEGQGTEDASGSESDREDGVVLRSESQSDEDESEEEEDTREDGEDEGEDEEEQEEQEEEPSAAPQRFFTPEGFRQAREYYERLIVQHPQLRAVQKGILALDFYPAMISLWVYEITELSRRRKWELKQSLRRRRQQEHNDTRADLDDGTDDEDGHETEFNNSGDSNIGSARRPSRRATRRTHRHHRALGLASLASTDLRAARLLAARLDELLLSPPSDTNAALLELRGHVAVWIGDLLVDSVTPAEPPPLSPSSEDEEEASDGADSDGGDVGEEEEDEAELELRDPETVEARREARREAREEVEVARESFLRAREAGAWLAASALEVLRRPYLGGRGAQGSSQGSEDGGTVSQDVDMDG